jgi:hypothetical protein
VIKTVIGALVFAALVTPALAAEYWIVQDPANKQCSIVEQKPLNSGLVVIGTSLPTRAAAEDSLGRIRRCGGSY